MIALLHFHFKEDPDNWSDEKFAEKWAQLTWVRKQNNNETIEIGG